MLILILAFENEHEDDDEHDLKTKNPPAQASGF
jgi:hypothetical protein